MTLPPLPPEAPTQVVRTRDGRDLAYVEYGDPTGPLVIHNHGGPSSRLEGRMFGASALSHGLRWVCVDRPGIGRSTPQASRSYEGWADDIVVIADALGAGRFGVSGWSEGGPWSLAAAAFLDPARLVHVTSIAGGDYGAFGDNWAAEYLDAADSLGGKLALGHPIAFHLMYEMLALDAVHFRTSYLKTLRKAVNDADREVLAGEYGDAMAEASAECFAQGVDGLVADSVLLYRNWSFDVTRIERPVRIWQGSGDRLVPLAINRTVAERTPGAVWHEVEGAGHFVAIGDIDRILDVAAEDLGAR